MLNKLKNFWKKICLAFYIIKSDNDLVLTDSCFHTSMKNLDILSHGHHYVCFENEDGGFDISYMIPWNMGKRCFTITVSRLQGDNAGAIADATLNLLNNHTMTGMITGDSENQPKPTNYIAYK